MTISITQALADKYRTDVRAMMNQATDEKKKSAKKRSIPLWVKERWDKRICIAKIKIAL